jgi:N-acetyltransferase
MNWLNNITLTGKKAKLVPLEMAHRDALLKAAADGKLWELWYTSVPSEQTIDQYISTALTEQLQQRSLPFAIIDIANDEVVGCTRYCNAEAEHKRLEIGYTWYASRCQRTGINTECKYLLLQHAFERLGCIAVEFRTHYYNRASRNAIARLGAKQDGILRNHRLDQNGLKRDTVVFSILDAEWPTVKYSLGYEMGRFFE